MAYKDHSQQKDSEKLVEKKLRDGVKARGGLSFKMLTGLVSGLPDRLCLLPGGIIFFAELKTTGLNARRLQQYWQRKFKKLGFDACVLDSVEKVNEKLEKYDAKRK